MLYDGENVATVSCSCTLPQQLCSICSSESTGTIVCFKSPNQSNDEVASSRELNLQVICSNRCPSVCIMPSKSIWQFCSYLRCNHLLAAAKVQELGHVHVVFSFALRHSPLAGCVRPPVNYPAPKWAMQSYMIRPSSSPSGAECHASCSLS